jgi:hypothetical protein
LAPFSSILIPAPALTLVLIFTAFTSFQRFFEKCNGRRNNNCRGDCKVILGKSARVPIFWAKNLDDDGTKRADESSAVSDKRLEWGNETW